MGKYSERISGINMRFAGFIMTYDRPDLLSKTLAKVFEQTTPPEKILIVDNSESDETELMIRKINDPRVVYHRVGFNSGPAGAARIGLEILAGQGFDWIYWGDDDDPPRIPDAFEKLLAIPNQIKGRKIGALGLIGNRYSTTTGTFRKIPNSELRGIVEVDSIAGNNTLLINGEAALQCELPEPKLFFGLEELDFCLSLKRGGFSLFIDGDAYYKLKQAANKNLNDSPISSFANLSFDKRSQNLWREYYSIRNLLFVITRRHRSFSATLIFLLKSILKAMVSYRKGFKFGFVYSKLTFFAISDAFLENMGKTVVPGSIRV